MLFSIDEVTMVIHGVETEESKVIKFYIKPQTYRYLTIIPFLNLSSQIELPRSRVGLPADVFQTCCLPSANLRKLSKFQEMSMVIFGGTTLRVNF